MGNGPSQGPDLLPDLPGQEEQGEEVGQGHQAVHGVPQQEDLGQGQHAARRHDAVVVAELDLIVDPYRHADWLEHVSHVERFAEQPERGLRCTACFAWSLNRTAEKALELDMNYATTLTVSPHKKSETIFRLCENDPRFEAYNFKKQDGFKRSLELSRELELYRQNFCGCEFSERK